MKIHTRKIRFQRDSLIEMTLLEIAPYLVKKVKIVFSTNKTRPETVTGHKLMKCIKSLATTGTGWIKISFEEETRITTFKFGPYGPTTVFRIKTTVEIKQQEPIKQSNALPHRRKA